MRVAPASSEFSSNSFTTEAGRSTTSPAAILLATMFGEHVNPAHGRMRLGGRAPPRLSRPSLAVLLSRTQREDGCPTFAALLLRG